MRSDLRARFEPLQLAGKHSADFFSRNSGLGDQRGDGSLVLRSFCAPRKMIAHESLVIVAAAVSCSSYVICRRAEGFLSKRPLETVLD
jgi:hypothetical protein